MSVRGRAATQEWKRLPWVTAEMRQQGWSGGEGCQMIDGLDTDAAGRRVIMSTDVGGLYLSEDAGAHWNPSNIGLTINGARCVAMDPANPRRILAANMGHDDFTWSGIYLSTDGGRSWKASHRLAVDWGQRAQIAYDPSSARDGLCLRAYWSPQAFRPEGRGLYRSDDGGVTWTQVNPTGGNSFLRVHPTRGTIYLGNDDGFYISRDRGAHLDRTNTAPVRGVAVSSAAPDTVWICHNYSIERSDDAGQTWKALACRGLPSSGINHSPGWMNLYASPADPTLLCVQAQTDGNMGWEKAPRYFSHDGGTTWSRPIYNYDGDFFPERIEGDAGRHLAIAFARNDKNVIYMNGVDYVMKSTDEGHTFRMSNTGYNGVMCFGRFNFNPFRPDLILWGAQDYNAALSGDGGRTWRRLDVSGMGTYGFIYGSYAFDDKNMFAGSATGWSAPRILSTSHDGGLTWHSTGLAGTKVSAESSSPDPTDPSVAFWDDLRTADRGATWQRMTQCDAVYTYSAGPDHALFGMKGDGVVRSIDHGLHWEPLGVSPTKEVTDLAFDPARNRLYLCGSWYRFYQYDLAAKTWTDLNPRLPADNEGKRGTKTVCVDPTNPAIVYTGNFDWYTPDTSVLRSTDAGLTWQRLTKTSPAQPGPDGGRMATCVRVHPQTHWLYVTTDCFGAWCYPPPP